MKNKGKWRVEWKCKRGPRRGCINQEWFISKGDANARLGQLKRGGFERSLWKEESK